jgi:hypothetical protein
LRGQFFRQAIFCQEISAAKSGEKNRHANPASDSRRSPEFKISEMVRTYAVV